MKSTFSIVAYSSLAISALTISAFFIKSTRRNNERSKENNAHDDNEEDEWFEHIPPHMKREVLKERRRREKLSLLAMKKPMYDNVQMIDSNGVMLAKISKKKAKWYVNKGLAEYCDIPDDIDGKESEKQQCIKINFKPKSNSNHTTYSTADKENICVKCGRGDYHLMRHHIVPSAYRSLLPKKYKSHMSHDITLLCGDCHLYCQQESQKKMNEIEEMCRPIGAKPRYVNNERLYKVRSSALALLNWKHQIPEKQISLHEKRVLDYLKSSDEEKEKDKNDKLHDEKSLTNSQLQQLIDMEYRIENPDFVPGPELVVNSIINDEEKIADFVRSWRRHFIETVHPRFLPDGWSIDHHVASRPR